MRSFRFLTPVILALGLSLTGPEMASADDLIPAKRLALSENTDLPGATVTPPSRAMNA